LLLLLLLPPPPPTIPILIHFSLLLRPERVQEAIGDSAANQVGVQKVVLTLKLTGIISFKFQGPASSDVAAVVTMRVGIDEDVAEEERSGREVADAASRRCVICAVFILIAVTTMTMNLIFYDHQLPLQPATCPLITLF
jgi:hypothetical protein